MAFADSFVEQIRQSGIMVNPTDVGDRPSMQTDIDNLIQWQQALEGDTREAIDQLTAENPVKQAFADPEVAIVASLGPVLAACDAAPASISITDAIGIISGALQNVQD